MTTTHKCNEIKELDAKNTDLPTTQIVLTIDEVFTLKQMVQWVMKSSRLSGMNKAFLEKTYNFLNERFEQAEKSNE